MKFYGFLWKPMDFTGDPIGLYENLVEILWNSYEIQMEIM